VGAGKREIVPIKQKAAKCMVVGDSVVRGVGDEHTEMVECFPGIKTEQLHKVIEKRDLGSPETVIIHVGTNDLRTTRNLDWIMGEIYTLATTAKAKFPSGRLVLSGVLRRSDVSWRRIGALNDRLDWVAGALGITFVDPNSWIEDNDFARDGMHLNGGGKRRLGNLYARLSERDAEASPVSEK
jgi:lysophospholipase L1-like esterase